MTSQRRWPVLLIIFWLIQVGVILILSRVLPGQLSRNLLLVLAVFNAGLIYLRQFDLPILTNVALILALAHLWQGGGFSSPLLASALIFTGVALSGLIVQSTFEPIGQDKLLAWFLIGLFTAEMASLTAFWPITYIQKSLLGTAIFYFVWQLWFKMSEVSAETRPSLRGHFIFVGLAVMVILVNIIWTTWPGLKTF